LAWEAKNSEECETKEVRFEAFEIQRLLEGIVAEDHNECYHISIVRVQLNLEVIEGEGDSKRTSQATIR